jgi:hypothetical protein
MRKVTAVIEIEFTRAVFAEKKFENVFPCQRECRQVRAKECSKVIHAGLWPDGSEDHGRAHRGQGHSGNQSPQ